MIEKLAIKLVTQMISEKLIEEWKKEQYIYVLISLGEKVITIGTIGIISLWIKNFIHSIFFLIFFLGLRKRTGGFHFDKFYKCYIGTIMSYIVVVFICPILANHKYILFELLLLSIGTIEWIGAVNHPNINMNSDELARTKNMARTIVILESVIILYFFMFGVKMIYIVYMSTAIILCAILLCVAKLKKQEVISNEED